MCSVWPKGLERTKGLDVLHSHACLQVSFDDCVTALQHALRKRGGAGRIWSPDIVRELLRLKKEQLPQRLCVIIRDEDIGKAIRKFQAITDLQKADLDIFQDDISKVLQ